MDMFSTPARRRLVLVGLALVAAAGAGGYALGQDHLVVRLVAGLVILSAGGAALAVVEAGRHGPADEGRRHAVTSDDEVTAESVLAAPGGASSGWWDGLAAHGPGYAHGTVYVRRDPGRWDRPGVEGPVCPTCGMDRGLDLVWLQGRPDLARVRCSDGTTWPAPAAWATPAAVAWALAQDEDEDEGAAPHERPGDDVDPAVAYLGEMIRREAGNTRPPSAGGAG